MNKKSFPILTLFQARNSTFTRRQTLIFIKDMLKEIIKSRGMKQTFIAQKIGVSVVTVSNWVQEKSSPSEKHLKKLSELLQVPLKDLVH
ncbi:helix-turn-helix transcriptional regulator [uncultured Draconibacterium sp.]|uniref:helix-turn-helix domain-containing protein n=1 Tax=uncultured Draconibacterium sp. TaxID=1573823 RepID=UPI0029C72F29|nr:helix-turn-helix transcriptional regulator [uncultured Draconibacterium sp.]